MRDKNTECNEFSLEGVCYSGKSTLAKSLSIRLKTPYLPEYSFYDRSVGRRNQFPPRSKKESLQSLRFFFDLDFKRNKIKQNQCKNLVLSDRSIVSIIAFEFVKYRQNIPNVFNQIEVLVNDYLTNQTVVLPSGWICLRFNDFSTLKSRTKSHNIGLKFLVENKTLDDLQFFYDVFSQKLKKYFLIIPAEENPRFQIESASSFIKQRIKSKNQLSEEKFLLVFDKIIKKLHE